MARRACPRTEVCAGGNGLLVIDTADFYGQVRAAAIAYGGYAFSPRLELFGQLEAVRYQTVISSVSASDLGLGHLSLGSTYPLLERDTYAVAVSGRVVLPTAFGLYDHAWPVALDVGATGQTAARRGLPAD